MTILGLETSTAVCSVGFYREGTSPIEQSIRESHIHSEKLLTMLQDLAGVADVQLKQIDGVAVSIGPGSFTGLRIGLSTAKGLCFALDKDLTAVPTFDAIAEAVRQELVSLQRVAVVIDAKRDEYYWALYQRGADGLSMGRITEVSISSLAALAHELDEETIIVTDVPSVVKRVVGAMRSVEEVHRFCRGSVVAALGAQQLRRGEKADGALLEPFYLKDFVVKSPTSLPVRNAGGV
jgi:tRNA threonylcarbamoyladenosine biosynthesis protein TsaB